MNNLHPDDLLVNVVGDLAECDWAIHDAFLPVTLTRQLAEECHTRQAQGLLAKAAVGRGPGQAVREGIRGDRIQWLESGQSRVTDAYLQAMEDMRLLLNRCLFLGLEDFEGHFALYPPGAFYQRHLDRFHDDDRRTLSAVFYLNEQWSAAQGGALRLYPQDRPEEDLLPLAGRLVLFNSATLPHEVLPGNRERLSLTGWFRRRGSRPW